jgi:glutathione S-transferase
MVKSLEGTGPPDPKEVARGERLITRFGAVLDQHLAARRFIAGEKVGLADFALGSSLQYQHLVAFPIVGFRNIDRWYHGLFDLRAWSETEPDWEALGLPGSPFMRRAA